MVSLKAAEYRRSALVACIFFSVLISAPLISEDVRLWIAPSAARAYAYGSRHLDATHPSRYDIKRAEFYLLKAFEFDSQYPNVQHQLARIAFLKGEFSRALARVNLEIEQNPNHTPSAYYLRGLIYGYMGNYDAAISDYKNYLESDPTNWAALNDYAWVLLKEGRFVDASNTTAGALSLWPENPWLLNTHAISLYELGSFDAALVHSEAAARFVKMVSIQDWLRAYPGNDPKSAESGIHTLQESIMNNMHMIQVAVQNHAVQSKQ